jgi:hypothetical protein
MALISAGLRITGLGEDIGALASMPWSIPLEEWPEDGSLAAQRGISRHIVRLVRSSIDENDIFAVKETVEEFANREYSILRELVHRNVPSVGPVAVVQGRVTQSGEELPCALVTKFLPYSQPYRVVLSGNVSPTEITNMANALALLLVQLHLLGFWWGDCSLSNTLFRRDAESFAAYLVDAETGEFQSQLSDGQREHDLEIARFNVAAELEDLKLAGTLDSAIDPIRASDGVIRRYRRLWTALKEPKYLDPNDRHAVERAMRSLHDLGFAVEEVEIKLDGDRHQLRFRPKLVEAGYHKQRLFTLTGIQSEELQAKRLLASLDRFYSRIASPRPVIEDVAKLWLVDVYQKVISEIPRELMGRVEDAQIFHEVLEHRWYLGEQAGRDLGLEYATKSYMETVLPHRTDSGPGEVTEIIS